MGPIMGLSLWGEKYRHPGQQSGRGGKFGLKINIVNKKNIFSMLYTF
jgi:hypothetical protein